MNFKYAKDAIAQQRLEGLEPSKDFVADLERAAHSEITLSEAIDNIEKIVLLMYWWAALLAVSLLSKYVI